MAEPNAAGSFLSSGLVPPTVGASGIAGGQTTPASPISGITNSAKGSVNANVGPITSVFKALGSSIDAITRSAKAANTSIDGLIKRINSLGAASKTSSSKMSGHASGCCCDPCGGSASYKGGGGGGAVAQTVFSRIKSSKDLVALPAGGGTGGGAGGGGGAQRALPAGGSTGGWLPAAARAIGGGGGGGFRPPPPGGGGPGGADESAGQSIGGGVMGTINNLIGNLTGQGGIGGLLMALPNAAASLYGAVAGGGIQYAYNRINGPAGNQNKMLQLSSALGPQAGMMGLSLPEMVLGLAQKMPVMGTQEDMLATALAGQSVGSFMKGTPGRNGFFEAVRQMQVLTPGAAPGQMAGSLAGYMQNTQTQKMGMYLGEGAFTMMGKGGRFKSLAEWAEGITKFMEQHRIGNQGQGFTKDELLSQNFPGSNINAWFQMLGVPQDMVDYWWNYVLTNTGQVSPVSVDAAKQTDQLRANVKNVRGIDLSYERLRNVTQGTRRDYLLGNKMYGMYGARESADRRFNVAMQGTDAMMAEFFSKTNVGALLAMLPTPVIDMLMPILTAVATSPVGAAASAVGGIIGSLGDVPIGDPPTYGATGATDTAHLSPSLAKNVKAMMAANPKLRITSGYRDSLTQNRLHRNGVGKVGPASTSSHTRGWAVDIGPKSEGAWLAANAGKFGLQSAYNKGEPWHIQMANTMTVGDPATVGGEKLGPSSPIGFLDDLNPVNIGKNVVGYLLDGLKNVILSPLKAITSIFSNLMKNFIGGGSLSNMIDTSTGVFSKLMLGPLSGLTSLLGKSNYGPNDVSNIINEKANIKLPVTAFEGFQSTGSNSSSGQMVFGDPVSSLMTGGGGTTVNANMGSPIIFNATITVNGMNGSTADAKRTASTLADHLQTELNKKKWLVS